MKYVLKSVNLQSNNGRKDSQWMLRHQDCLYKSGYGYKINNKENDMKKYNFNAGPSILPREVIEATELSLMSMMILWLQFLL